jgi:2-(3-amino-3-carboxypropyl)histidine synthase
MEVKLGNYLEKLRKIKPKRILLQLPEGLKIRAIDIASEIEKEIEAEVIISAEPCYGACDLRLEEAKLLNCDLILHFAHSDFGVKSDIPILYIPVEIDLEIPEELREKLKKIKEKEICIYTSGPFKKTLDELENYLKKIGKKIVEKKIILGCSLIKEKGEANIFVGSGKFHCFALLGKTYFLDLEKSELKDITNLLKKEEMKRQARISKFKEAKKIGILVSKKPGQFYKDYEKIKQKLEKEGKEVKILILDEITDSKLLGYNFDFYFNTACPRILDTTTLPIINLRDLFNYV